MTAKYGRLLPPGVSKRQRIDDPLDEVDISALSY